MNKIEEIYQKFSSKGQIIDCDSIIEIVKYLIKTNQLERYLQKVKFNKRSQTFSKKELNPASYDNSNRQLNINIEDIEENVRTEERFYGHNLTQQELQFFRNIIIIQSILHEIEHVKQVKMIDDNPTLESEICKWSTAITIPEEIFNKNKKDPNYMEEIRKQIAIKQALYIQNYKYCPPERWAELNSFNKIITMNSNLDNFQMINDIYRFLIAIQEIKGYSLNNGRIISPTLRYLINLGYEDQLRNYAWYLGNNTDTDRKIISCFDYQQRLYYGFPLNQEEVKDKCFEYKDGEKRLLKK